MSSPRALSQPGGGQVVRQNPYLAGDKKNCFGRSEWIDTNTDPARGVELVRVDVEQVQNWTVTVKVPQLLAGAVVVAHVEYGSGNATAQLDIDASDQVDVPVTGDHVRVWISVLAKVNGNFAAALVSAVVSAETWPDKQPSFTLGANTWGAAASGEVSAVPTRMRSFHAVSTAASGGTTLYLLFFNSPVVPPPGTIPDEAFALPPVTNVTYTWPTDRPFNTALTWALSTTPADYVAPGGGAPNALVSVDLARLPNSQYQAAEGNAG